MNRFLLIVLLTLCHWVFGQQTNVESKQLNEQEIQSIFTDSLREKLNIDFAIYRVYAYQDKAGKHYIVMTENSSECDSTDDCYDAIKNYCFSFLNNRYTLEWSFRDFILPNSSEFSITNWTKYFTIEDHDGDGLADPILVYGTFGANGTDEGRIKILCYYKNKKIAIRHQNGLHDNERNTQVDISYYDLPLEIRNRVKVIMQNITKNEHGIFPNGWQKEMEKRKLNFDEN